MNALAELLRRRPEAFCERIICLHRPTDDPEWWHSLEDGERPLFGPHGRILEASMDDVAEAARDAVTKGLRPFFFVRGAGDWPSVFETMGHYQDFGAVYVLGRDDEAMCELLHSPSVEVLEIYAGEGRILVPDLGYGKALDRLLPIDMTDFERDEAGDRADRWRPHFALVSRLNALRRLALELDCLSGEAIVQQFYDPGIENSAQQSDHEPCDLPISFLDRRLQFAHGTCKLDAGQRDQITQILEQLALPVPHWGLLHRLAQLARGVKTRLTGSQQRLLANLSRQADETARLFEATTRWLEEISVQPDFATTRGETSGSAAEEHALRVLIMPLEDLSAGGRLSCRWFRDQPPAIAPDILLHVNGKRAAHAVSWSDNRRSLSIEGLDLTGAEIGWTFPSENVLEVLIELPSAAESGQTFSDVKPQPSDGRSKLPADVAAIFRRAGIELVARGRDLALRLDQAAMQLLWGIYDPDAVRVRGADDTLAADVEGALEGQVPVVTTRLLSTGDDELVLDLQWIAMAPEDAPGVAVEVGGTAAIGTWDDWVPDDLPKALRIEADAVSAKNVVQLVPVVDLVWEESRNRLRVWIEREASADSV